MTSRNSRGPSNSTPIRDLRRRPAWASAARARLAARLAARALRRGAALAARSRGFGRGAARGAGFGFAAASSASTRAVSACSSARSALTLLGGGGAQLVDGAAQAPGRVSELVEQLGDPLARDLRLERLIDGLADGVGA